MVKMLLKRKQILTSLICLTSLCFLSNACWAIPSVKEIKIPSKYGAIKETYDTQMAQNAQITQKPTIIHIQDAHCNYEAQKNMAQLLEYLVKEQKLKLIMVEGGSGDVNLSFLRNYADKKTREEVADKYLKKGEISGEEYLDIVSDYNIELYGIEDQALYDAHMSAFGKVDGFREEGLKYVEALNSVVRALKPYLYSTRLKQLEERRESYDNKTVSLVEYCQYLKETADNAKLDVTNWPNLVAFTKTALLEKKVNFTQAETERNAFIRDLAKVVDETAVKELISKSQDFKAGKITPAEYYSFLKAAGGQKLSLEYMYPELNAYIQYVTLSKEISTKDLLKEINAIENKIKESFSSNPDQKSLSDIAKSLSLLSRLLNLEFTPEDYEYFQANQTKFLSSFWTDFLTRNCQKYNLVMPTSASHIIDNNLGTLKEFYRLGTKREDVFVKNLINKMQESKEKIAVLITGGFHTPGITKMLKEEGYSYLVITPAVTKKGDSNVYLSVLRRETKSQQKAVNADEE